ncbi:hypothetical protein T02_2015 [Trichinella nativa]|uniref:Uncharacterized protein n=1 Tax=Trichinella nativa TaxID=6335 RepID=A0A0V1KK69_9BILA|nr:hypothetical protein T02_2015 [Trichinella nativa]
MQTDRYSSYLILKTYTKDEEVLDVKQPDSENQLNMMIDWFCNLMFCNRISVKTEVSCLVTVKVKCPNCSLSDFPHRKSKNK